MLYDFVTKCYVEVDKNNMKSIAFPALGTGSLAFPCDIVASTMYRAANAYLQGKTDSGISKVYFVIWKDDTATLKVAACYACSRNNQTINETHIFSFLTSLF